MLTRPAAAALLLDLCLGASAAGAVTVPMGPRVGAPYEPGLTAALSRASCSSLHGTKIQQQSRMEAVTKRTRLGRKTYHVAQSCVYMAVRMKGHWSLLWIEQLLHSYCHSTNCTRTQKCIVCIQSLSTLSAIPAAVPCQAAACCRVLAAADQIPQNVRIWPQKET
jgi:hypothetical protein